MSHPGIMPAFRYPVSREVFQRGYNIFATPHVSSLQPPDISTSHTPTQERIFPVSLFHPRPTQFPGNIQHWPVTDMPPL